MIVLTKTFIPYEQFDLDSILKVTAAIDDLNLADMSCGPKAHYQAIVDVLLSVSIGSTNMG